MIDRSVSQEKLISSCGIKMVFESDFRVQVEICQKNNSDLSKEVLKDKVKKFLRLINVILIDHKKYVLNTFENDQVLKNHVEFFDLIPSTSKWPVK